MNDEELRDEYRKTVPPRGAHGACPDLERLTELVERTGTEDRRLQTLDHVMTCVGCRKEFDLLNAIVAGRPAARRYSARPLALAASLAALIGAGSLWVTIGNGPQADVVRGGRATVELTSPVRAAAAPRPVVFTWRPVDGEPNYAFEVIGPEGDATFTGTTRDTSFVLPATVVLSPELEYRWWVRALMSDGAELTSPVQTFRVR